MPVELVVENHRRGFITGSWAYGEPTPESDVDLVLLVDSWPRDILLELSETKKVPVRYGKLNLILCYSEEEYDAWYEFTNDMLGQRILTGKPVSSEEAKAAFLPRRIRCGSGSKAD